MTGLEADPAVHQEAARMAADSLAALQLLRVDSLLRIIAPLSRGEEARLRRHLQEEHLAAARSIGIEPVDDRRTAGLMMSEPPEVSGVVPLRTNDFYIIDPRMGYAVPLLVRPAATALDRIGQRFQKDLRALGLPPYRFIVTNVLRTGIDQAHLRGTNANAARGESAHEYGTTFDLYYGRFHSRLRHQHSQAYRELGRAHADALKAVLGRALIAMQEEEQIVVTTSARSRFST
ncbi:MAG: DUF5715 family protein [Rhodothermales bacterium]